MEVPPGSRLDPLDDGWIVPPWLYVENDPEDEAGPCVVKTPLFWTMLESWSSRILSRSNPLDSSKHSRRFGGAYSNLPSSSRNNTSATSGSVLSTVLMTPCSVPPRLPSLLVTESETAEDRCDGLSPSVDGSSLSEEEDAAG